MDRLTEETQLGPFASLKDKAEARPGAFHDYDCLYAHMVAVTQLKAYEDTGLSPADIATLAARAAAAEADLRKCAPCWLCKKKCGIFDALDQRKDGCCPNFEYRGSQAGKGAAPNE